MKYLVLTILCVGVLIGSAVYLGRVNKIAGAASVATAAPAAQSVKVNGRASESGAAAHPVKQSEAAPSVVANEPTPSPAHTVEAPRMDPLAVVQAVDALLSDQAPYEQKRAAWKRLREEGGLDTAITELQQRVANNPASADCAAVLGHAYLHKCGMINDLRDQGTLAMQADKLFDTALNLDPQNWEARFTKAVGLSYWPASMGKSDEVIQHFTTLIQQQETQPTQPQFAESYLWLGDQYQKAGRNDDAHNVWARGAAFFPSDQKLNNKLASSP